MFSYFGIKTSVHLFKFLRYGSILDTGSYLQANTLFNSFKVHALTLMQMQLSVIAFQIDS